MMPRRQWVLLLAGAVVWTLAAQAQPPQRPMGKRGMVRPSGRGPGFPPPGRKGGPKAREHGNMVDHLMTLPPQDQREFMRNDPRFQSLPPGQQENIQRRLDEFNNMPPRKREALRERFELFRQLPAEQQDRARGLYRQWNQHSPERRQELMREFRQLRMGSPEDRRERLESEEFRNRFSDREQELLRGLADLLPPE